MSSLRVQIESGARDVNAEAFLKVLGTTLDVLKELDKHSSQFGGESIEWFIADVGKNSPVFAEISGGVPSQDNVTAATQVIGAFVSGLAFLEENGTCPQHFNERALDLAAELTRSFSKGVTRIDFSANGSRASVSHQLARNANKAKSVLELERGDGGSTYKEYGTIEGRLRTLESLGSKDKIVIEDDLTGEQILCYCRDAEIEQQVRKAWKQRVSISGEITVSRETGKPHHVDIEEHIVAFPSRAELPQMEDLHGINITQGIDPVEYIRGLRDAE